MGMVPELKQIFEVDGLATWQAMLANFAFFAAYFVFSTPAAWLIEAIGYKNTMVVSLFVQVVGALMFLPAAQMVSFPLFLAAIFIVGAGVTALQTAANPYVGHPGTGGERAGAADAGAGLQFAGRHHCAAGSRELSFLQATSSIRRWWRSRAPAAQHAYQMTIANTVRMPYIVVAIVLVVLGVAVAFAHLPHIKAEEKKEAGGRTAERSIWSFRHTVLAAVGIFFYVGVEVGLATTMVLYFSDSTHGGLNVMTLQLAQKTVALYWGGALVGRLLGPWMMNLMKPGKLLGLFGVVAAALVALAMFVPGYTAVGGLILAGFFNSVMFPTIFALGIVGLGPLTSRGSGIITTMVVGGALIPVLIGWIVDHASYQVALIIPVICYLYIAWYGVSGSKPAASEAVV